MSLRTSDPEPRSEGRPAPIVASAETLAFAVATGEIGDPRSFKRPVRVTVPRTLPTDDVLVLRDKKAADAASKKAASLPAETTGYRGGTLPVATVSAALAMLQKSGRSDVFVVATSLEEVRAFASVGSELAPFVRALGAPFVPTATVAHLSGCGIAVLGVSEAAAKRLHSSSEIVLPAPSESKDELTLSVGGESVVASWLARGVERTWAISGSSRDAKAISKK